MKKVFLKGFMPIWNGIRTLPVWAQVPALPLFVLVSLGFAPIVIATLMVKNHYKL